MTWLGRIFFEKIAGNTKKKLIEEIDSKTETEPKYVLKEIENGIKLKIFVPLIENQKDFEVEVSKNKIQFFSAGKYNLKLNLEKEINENEVSATFNIKSKNLTLKMSLL